jgi:hypothetical protein
MAGQAMLMPSLLLMTPVPRSDTQLGNRPSQQPCKTATVSLWILHVGQ